MERRLAEQLGEGARVAYTLVGDPQDQVRADRTLSILNDAERTRHDRFRFAEDKASYREAHALLRTTLSGLLGEPPASFGFESTEHGRPELASGSVAGRLRFNISHTRGLVACAVAWERDVGVDVETIARRTDHLKIADTVMSPREISDLMAVEGVVQRRRFFEYWTLKESYIKAVGKGFALPLKGFTMVRSEGPMSRVEFDERIDDVPEQWRFETRPIGEGFMLSVAVRANQSAPCTIVERFL